MIIAVSGENEVKEEFVAKASGHDIRWFEKEPGDQADVFFILHDNMPINPEAFSNKPVFLNAVNRTLDQWKLPENFLRMNGWPGFINRELWEVSGDADTARVLEKLGWKYTLVNDSPGMVSARIISMIINEAYFALEEKVSSKKEIDTAMKLGTNYPFGPFEWSEKIGLKKICSLLEDLERSDRRYAPATLLKAESAR